jgi:hypothetical protein
VVLLRIICLYGPPELAFTMMRVRMGLRGPSLIFVVEVRLLAKKHDV